MVDRDLLERVMNFVAEKAVLCKYTQASSLRWAKRNSRQEAQERAIQIRYKKGIFR